MVETIVMVAPGRAIYSETFIRAHLERLPARVRLVYGGTHQEVLPRFHDDGQRLAAGGPLARLRRLVGPPAGPAEKEALKRFLRASGAQAVLAEFGPSGVAAMDACQELRLPLVVHFHGYDAYHRDVLEGPPGRRYPAMFQQAGAIVAVSAAMERQLLSLGAPRKKLHLNPYGVDLDRFQGARPDQAGPLFVAVGRFVDKKAPLLTLLAFSRLAAEAPTARLMMVGDGPLLEACRQLRAALGLQERVELPGPRSPEEVAALFQRARAFVQHSVTTEYGDSEGTPLSILEASAAGLPVIATRHAGIPEVVADRESGLLVDEGDVEGMARAMARLVAEPETAAGLGAAGRRRIQAGYSMEERIAALWSIIQAAIGRG
jgi:glycosyltransferase involved in cell wall biosynthesis